MQWGYEDKGMIHIGGRMEQNGLRLHHDSQKDIPFKTDELFISGISILYFQTTLPMVTETVVSEINSQGRPRLLY